MSGPNSPTPLPFVGLDELDERPHVIVDGAARPGSLLVLSHWPASPTPTGLWRDLSIETAFAYLESPSDWVHGPQCVTTDHVDEDGLASLYVLTEPEQAVRLKERLIAFGRAGDFGDADRDAARATFAMQQLIDKESSPWADEQSPPGFATRCQRGLLGLLAELIEHPDHFEDAWRDEDAVLAASLAALEDGTVVIEEHPLSEMAVVHISAMIGAPPVEVGHGHTIPLHPVAIHCATQMPRILVVGEGITTYYDRYETWVRYMSRRLSLRRDLVPLAEELSYLEPGGQRWQADSPGSISPVLAPLAGRTELAAAVVVACVERYLLSAPVAWDPFATASPLTKGPASKSA